MVMDRHQRGVLFTGLTSFFLSVAMLYQMSPFFQLYAKETAGASAATVGLIFAVLPASAFVFSIPAAKYISCVGERIALASGLLLLAGSSVMFGLCRSVEGWVFWRAVQGAATAPIYTTVACMFAKTFTGPGEFAFVNGLQEAMASIGFAVGPMLGGCLFQWGGFLAPFAVSACMHLAFVFLSLCTPTTGKKREDGNQPLLDDPAPVLHAGVLELCYGELLVVVPAGMLVPGIFGALDPVLAAHLRRTLGDDVDPSTIGTLMSIPAFPCVILSLFVPYLMKAISPDRVIAMGVLILATTSVFMGLSDPDAMLNVGYGLPFEPGSQAQWALQISLFVALSFGSAFGWNPVMPDLMDKACERIATKRGISREDAIEVVSPSVSSLFNAAAALGEAAGPVLGGSLLSRFGFGGAYVLLALVFFLYGCVLLFARALSKDDGHGIPNVPMAQAPKLRTAVPIKDIVEASTPKSAVGRALSFTERDELRRKASP